MNRVKIPRPTDGGVVCVLSWLLSNRTTVLKLLNEMWEVVQLYRMRNKIMSRAYEDGHYAGYHGESDDSCPYDPDDQHGLYWEWMEGYIDGDLDAEEEGFK